MSDEAVTRHPDELLQELLDGRLEGTAAAEVEAHLAGCERCRRLRDTLASTRRLLRETAAEEAPADLRHRLETALAEAVEAPSPRRRGARVLWLAAAVLVAAAIGALLWLRPATPPDPVTVLASLQASAKPIFTTSDAAVLTDQLEKRAGFRPRVLDLSMMGIRIAGGGTATIAGHSTAWTLYEGPPGRLLCAMFQGRLNELPRALEIRRRAPFTFRVYDRGGVTVVAWQEGKLVCILVGTGDREQVIKLAMAKAMLPT